MEAQTITARNRRNIGSHAARRLRREGGIPGIIYGHGEAPQAFSVDRHELEVELLHGHRLLSLNLDGRSGSYLIKEVQYDPMGSEVLHIDLARVDLHEKVTVEITVELRGTPKGLSDGGVLDQMINQLEIECLASNIPDEIRATVTHLGVGDSLTVGDLELPEGVVSTHESDEVVAIVRVVAEEAEPEEAEETEAVEPEIISKGKGEEEESSD